MKTRFVLVIGKCRCMACELEVLLSSTASPKTADAEEAFTQLDLRGEKMSADARAF